MSPPPPLLPQRPPAGPGRSPSPEKGPRPRPARPSPAVHGAWRGRAQPGSRRPATRAWQTRLASPPGSSYKTKRQKQTKKDTKKKKNLKKKSPNPPCFLICTDFYHLRCLALETAPAPGRAELHARSGPGADARDAGRANGCISIHKQKIRIFFLKKEQKKNLSSQRSRKAAAPTCPPRPRRCTCRPAPVLTCRPRRSPPSGW